MIFNVKITFKQYGIPLTECTSTVFWYLAWWWFSEPKHVAEFLILIANIRVCCFIDWINYCITIDFFSHTLLIRNKRHVIQNMYYITCAKYEMTPINNFLLYFLCVHYCTLYWIISHHIVNLVLILDPWAVCMYVCM